MNVLDWVSATLADENHVFACDNEAPDEIWLTAGDGMHVLPNYNCKVYTGSELVVLDRHAEPFAFPPQSEVVIYRRPGLFGHDEATLASIHPPRQEPYVITMDGRIMSSKAHSDELNSSYRLSA